MLLLKKKKRKKVWDNQEIKDQANFMLLLMQNAENNARGTVNLLFKNFASESLCALC